MLFIQKLHCYLSCNRLSLWHMKENVIMKRSDSFMKGAEHLKKRYHLLLCLMAALAVSFLPCVAVRAEAFVQAGSAQYSVADSGFLQGLQIIVPSEGNQLLYANLVVKTAADAQEPINNEQLLLAVDEDGRAYTPILYSGGDTFTASLAPGEKSLRVLFEVPDTAGSYDLVVLSEAGGEAAGRISLGKSSGPVVNEAVAPLATISAEGYCAVIHNVFQRKTAFMDEAPDGMKYVWIDVTFTGTGTQAPVSELASKWVLNRDGMTEEAVIPTRANQMLALINVRFNNQLPAVRGMICFLVPEDMKELTGLTGGQTTVGQKLPITGELAKNEFAKLGADGAYHQAGWKVTVSGMRLEDKGSLADPPAGFKYVIANVTVENGSTQNLAVSSELNFAMTDSNGNELTQAWFADLAETLDASLLPGESAKGEVAFLLPDGAKAGTLRVHLNMLGEPLLIDAAGYLAE
jgi:hypothetical protein